MNRSNVFLIPLFLVFFSIVLSCDDDNGTDESTNKEIKTLQLTEKICTDFALKLHESFVNNDTSFLNTYINWDEIKKQSFTYSSENDSTLNSIIWDKIKDQIFFGRDFAQVSAMGGS
jgi:hypothetical protein